MPSHCAGGHKGAEAGSDSTDADADVDLDEEVLGEEEVQEQDSKGTESNVKEPSEHGEGERLQRERCGEEGGRL